MGLVSGGGIRKLLRAAWRAYWEQRIERAAAELLRLLDTDALRDIGLERGEFHALILGAGDHPRGDCPCHQPRQGGPGNGPHRA
jgi:uncharacterized protein YjiS (DUF1127 family)